MYNGKPLRRSLFPNTDKFQPQNFIFWKPCHTSLCPLEMQLSKGAKSKKEKSLQKYERVLIWKCWRAHSFLSIPSRRVCFVFKLLDTVWPKPHPMFWKAMPNGWAESEQNLNNFDDNVRHRTEESICKGSTSVPIWAEITVLFVTYFPGWFARGLFPVKHSLCILKRPLKSDLW